MLHRRANRAYECETEVLQMTEVELHLLSKQLREEQRLIQMFKLDAKTAGDPQLKQKSEQLAGAHQKHYDALLKCLQNGGGGE